MELLQGRERSNARSILVGICHGAGDAELEASQSAARYFYAQKFSVGRSVAAYPKFRLSLDLGAES